jgi:Na+-transporting NADH:ubiquinone oxidoreductase subunit C
VSENLRVLRFAVIICLACSLMVSAAAIGLRDRQEANLQLDIQKNILKSVDLYDAAHTREEVGRTFQENLVGLVLTPAGEVLEGRTPSDVDPDSEPDLLPLYEVRQDGQVAAYTFPIVGKGLWSTLYGYFALESDLDTVKGITFYQHGETPGLGGEIEKEWFQQNFIGKKILTDDGGIMSVSVVKGTAADRYPEPGDLQHYVDGISGATITSKGVSEMVARTLRAYEPYFSKVRQETSS